MKSVTQPCISLQIQPPNPRRRQISLHYLSPAATTTTSPPLAFFFSSFKPHSRHPFSIKFQQQTHLNHTQPNNSNKKTQTQDDGGGIPIDQVKTLARFKSLHNHITVIQVSRAADHPFAGSRLLLLDIPGNIHSISFLLPNKLLTSSYFDVFATLPPLLPPGPLALLGFGAGSAAKIILESYPDRLKVYIGDAMGAEIEGGFSGILVDLFSKGCLIPELQDPSMWEKMKGRLRSGGRIMVNVGGSCVEAEDEWSDGKAVMEESLRALDQVFPGQVSVLSMGNRGEDSSVAMTGKMPDVDEWKRRLPKALRFHADMWTPFRG